jgi:hypothetical protein
MYTMTEDDKLEVMLKYHPAYEKPTRNNWFVRDDYNWLKYIMQNAVQKIEDAVTER